MNRERAKQATFFLLRVVSGLLFLHAGGMKILDWFGGVPVQFGGHPALMSQVGIGGVLEFYGGAASLPVLFCFIFLFFAAHGAGQWSLDAWLRRKRG